MKKVERTPLTRENWSSNFTLIGKAVIKKPEYTFKIDERSEKSAWIYNLLNLGVDCGEKYGTVYAEMMGGYSDERENVIYAHGKKDDGSDDFSNHINVAWEDRFKEDVLDEIGDLCFITVGLEKTNKGKTYVTKFLSAYDAIKYIEEHLEDGMVINVRGTLNYSSYQGTTQVRKNINSIFLSGVDDESKYVARFTQSILLDKDSASLKEIDKDKGVMYVNAYVLDYVKKLNGVDISGQYPFTKQFEYEFADLNNGDRCKRAFNSLFKVKKGVTQITFDGEFIESGATVTMTYDDLPDDIKELVDCDVFTVEQAIAKCTSNGNKERRMVLRTPYVKQVGEEKTPVIQKFEEKYTEDDLIFDFPDEDIENEDVTEVEDTTVAEDTDAFDGLDGDDTNETNDLDWLDKL